MKAPRFAVIILAAGLSSRMQQFKPLLPLGKATVTDHVIATFKSLNVDVLLVVGCQRNAMVAAIKERDIVIVYNPDYEKEMLVSIQAGVRQLRLEHDAFFILPVDIPLVKAATIRQLMAAAQENPKKIIYPTFNGKRGHPPLLPASLIPAILGWDKGGGLKAILDEYEKLSLEVAVEDEFILEDIDTPEDYQKLLRLYHE